MEAYYLGSREVSTKFGDQQVHDFERKDGKKISVWGFTRLNMLLENTPKLALTKITYTGKSEEANKYGNKSHTCTVFFDAKDKLENFTEADPKVEDNDDLPF
jgi:hypothetical protein